MLYLYNVTPRGALRPGLCLTAGINRATFSYVIKRLLVEVRQSDPSQEAISCEARTTRTWRMEAVRTKTDYQAGQAVGKM